MTNIEIMQRATDYAINRYVSQNYNNPNVVEYDDEQMGWAGVEYSAMVMQNLASGTLINGKNPLLAYTREGNLRDDMQNLSKEAIKNELLKNVVNVTSWHRLKDTRVGKILGNEITQGMTDDEISAVLCNIMEQQGVQAAYDLLNDSMILSSVCRSFSWYRKGRDYSQRKGYINEGNGKLTPFYGESDVRNVLDTISTSYNTAIKLNDELDAYYAKNAGKINNYDGYEYQSEGYGRNY